MLDPAATPSGIPEELRPRIQHAAELIDQADGLIIAAGAGMGVDSGLPDFRGPEGFWQAYPALGRAGLGFMDVANPRAFGRTPELAWGFYGHRLALYRATEPHTGFGILQRWAKGMNAGATVFTSNVDGQFQKAGFDPERVYECHGSIHHLQCFSGCCDDIWPADSFTPYVDQAQGVLRNKAPTCPRCGGLARPNILMFGDPLWLPARSEAQSIKLEHWLALMRKPVVIEVGAGTAVPSVRNFSQQMLIYANARLVRINTTEAQVPSRDDVGLPWPALMALQAIDEALSTMHSA
jgi:NAD-dependent SIR2 family protein deacetylase